MGRYQCPFCPGFHQDSELAKCSRHGVNSSRSCTECLSVAEQSPCRPNGGQS